MSAFILNESTGQYHTNGPVSNTEIIDQAKQILQAMIRRPEQRVFTDPSSVKTFLHLALSTKEREIFAVLFLNNRHRLIQYEEMFFGTIDGASVHPREVVKAALTHNAAAVILAHNHPSGDADPSEADRRITERLRDALALVDVRVLDHLVVGSDECISFAERGLI